MKLGYLCLEMETGAMDGWWADKKDCENMIVYFKELFPESRWTIVQAIEANHSRISDNIKFTRGGQKNMIEKYGQPINIP
jgi:hypothetical protein